MKSLVVVVLCLFLAVCLALPVDKVTLDSVDTAASGDANTGHLRLARYGGYYPGGYGDYGDYYPSYSNIYPTGGLGGGYGGGYGSAQSQASADASALGDGLGYYG